MIVEKHIVIEGNHQLNGEIEIKGATKAESSKEYEDDLKKEATEPILNGE